MALFRIRNNEVDGTGVPMIGAETEGHAGKGEDGRAHTREAKLYVLTQTGLDEEGRPVRDPRSSSYLVPIWPRSPPQPGSGS